MKLATNFALEMKTQLSLQIGIHFGGPIVAGILSLKRPHFQLLGETIELVSDVAHACPMGQIYITQSLYELIFGSSLPITEKGNVMLRSGKSMELYLVVT